jgi:pimeloyl-ACP methyl ester carboxylesterase
MSIAHGIRLHRAELIDGIAMIVPAIIAEDPKRTLPPHKILVEDPAVRADLTPAEADFFDIAVVRSHKWLDYERTFPQVPEDENGDPEFLSKIREQPEKYAFSFEVDNVSEPFPGPSLIITGRQDAMVGYRDAWNILEKYPRATYVVFDRAGHLLEEKADLVNALMNEWLDRVEESAALR